MQPALYEKQFEPGGFGWVDLRHRNERVFVYRRKGKNPKDDLLIILNIKPATRHDWKVYTCGKNSWKEIFNSDEEKYWGTGDVHNLHPRVNRLDKNTSLLEINVHLPSLGAVVLK